VPVETCVALRETPLSSAPSPRRPRTVGRRGQQSGRCLRSSAGMSRETVALAAGRFVQRRGRVLSVRMQAQIPQSVSDLHGMPPHLASMCGHKHKPLIDERAIWVDTRKIPGRMRACGPTCGGCRCTSAACRSAYAKSWVAFFEYWSAARHVGRQAAHVTRQDQNPGRHAAHVDPCLVLAGSYAQKVGWNFAKVARLPARPG
jgi:hypothetical protein